MEICRREGEAASYKIEKWIQHYVQMYRLGNPQILLETFLEPAAPSPVKVACNYIRGAGSDGAVYCTKDSGGLWIQGLKCYNDLITGSARSQTESFQPFNLGRELQKC